MIWQTDAMDIDISKIDNLLYKNHGIEQFLNEDSRMHFISAEKGVGKTLLLKAKRHNLTKKIGRECILVPSDSPYLDTFSQNLIINSSLRNKFEIDLKLLTDIWKLSFKISAISYWYSEINENNLKFGLLLKDEYQDILYVFKEYILAQKKITPCEVFEKIISFKVSELCQFIDDINAKTNINEHFRDIHSKLYFFIDKIDQSMTDLDSEKKKIWINVQCSLILASLEMMQFNQHIEIYTSIRQEAFSNMRNEMNPNLNGSVFKIEYKKEDVLKMINTTLKANKYNGFDDYIRYPKIRNAFFNVEENTFDYLYRRTTGKPRELIDILFQMETKGISSYSEEDIRNDVNDVFSKTIVDNIFIEKIMFSSVLNTDDKREKFFSLMNHNILTKKEMTKICKEFNKIQELDCRGNCLNCNNIHPFCELYNLGFLGIKHLEPQNNEYRQKFRQAYDIKDRDRNIIPDSSFYFLHPSLRIVLSNPRSYIVHSVLIGHSYIWKKWYDKVIEIQKEINNRNLSNDKQDDLLAILDKIDDQNYDEVLNRTELKLKTIKDELIKNYLEEINIGIITIINEEKKDVSSVLKNKLHKKEVEKKDIFQEFIEYGQISLKDGRKLNIKHIQTQVGNSHIINTVNAFYKENKQIPSKIFLVGTSGAISDKLNIGDVVFATILFNYDIYRVNPNNVVDFRTISKELTTVNAGNVNNFIQEIDKSDITYDLTSGVISSVSIIINDLDSRVRKQILDVNAKTLVTEMEGYGFLIANSNDSTYSSIDKYIIRGVSDKADGNKHDGDKNLSSKNAVDALLKFIEYLHIKQQSN